MSDTGSEEFIASTGWSAFPSASYVNHTVFSPTGGALRRGGGDSGAEAKVMSPPIIAPSSGQIAADPEPHLCGTLAEPLIRVFRLKAEVSNGSEIFAKRRSRRGVVFDEALRNSFGKCSCESFIPAPHRKPIRHTARSREPSATAPLPISAEEPRHTAVISKLEALPDSINAMLKSIYDMNVDVLRMKQDAESASVGSCGIGKETTGAKDAMASPQRTPLGTRTMQPTKSWENRSNPLTHLHTGTKQFGPSLGRTLMFGKGHAPPSSRKIN